MEQTFGTYIRQRRQARGLTLRGLAARVGLSPVYMSNIETDRRPAPSQEYLDKLAVELALGKDEVEQMLDLAARSRDQRVPADLPDYIMERDSRLPRGAARWQGQSRHTL